jgi:hypothetical protein
VSFVLRSLKTQDELTTLRAVYGPRLIVIAAYSPKENRTGHLAGQIESSRGTKDRTKWIHQPEALIERDENEEQARGQDVSGTFHRGTSSCAAGTALSRARTSSGHLRFSSTNLIGMSPLRDGDSGCARGLGTTATAPAPALRVDPAAMRPTPRPGRALALSRIGGATAWRPSSTES